MALNETLCVGCRTETATCVIKKTEVCGECALTILVQERKCIQSKIEKIRATREEIMAL